MARSHLYHLLYLTQLLKRKLSKELNWWSKQASRSSVPRVFPRMTFHASARPSRKSTMVFEQSRSGKVSPVGFFATVKQGLQEKALKIPPVGVHERLFRQARELEKKKQMLRESLKVNYSFRPQIAANTHKWLNLRLKRQCKAEEVAVVSSANTLGVFQVVA